MSKKILTERAHYMTPGMHFGLAFEINAAFDESRIADILDSLRKHHPLLSSVVTTDADGSPVYEQSPAIRVPLTIKSDSSDWLRDYDEITGNGWDLRTDCLLRVIAYPKDTGIFLVFAAHHLLCDGIALLQLAESFSDIYVNSSSCPAYNDRIIASTDEFGGRLKTPFIVSFLASSANKKWLKAGQSVSYDDYRKFETDYVSKRRINHDIQSISGAEFHSICEFCAQYGMTVNDWLIAEMMVTEHTNKVIVGANIRKHLTKYEKKSLGNYSSAYTVRVGTSGDVWTVGRAVAKVTGKIKKNPSKELLTLALYSSLDQNLLDAAPISALGGFESEAGLFVGDRLLGLKKPGNYSVTNLGRLESEIIKDIYFIPPCSPSVKKITGIITLNGKMNMVSCSPRN